VNFALGCDGEPSNNCHDLIREMKLAALIYWARLFDPESLPVEMVLKMAASNGARVTEWGKGLGPLELNGRN